MTEATSDHEIEIKIGHSNGRNLFLMSQVTEGHEVESVLYLL